MPQTSFVQPTLLLGQIGDATPKTIDTYVNPLLAQISAITIGGNDAGTYAVRIEGGGEIIDASFVKAGAETVADIIDALILDLAVQSGFSGTATAAEADPDLDLVFLTPGIAYTITFPTNPSGNMSVANSQEAGGVDVPLAVVVAQGGDGEARLPSSGPVAGVSQVSVITLGGTDDGVYTVTITGNGFTWVGTITASSDTAPVILGAILAGMEGDLGFDADCDGSVAATVLTFTFNKPGVVYSVVLTVNQDTNMVLTEPVAPAAAIVGDTLLGFSVRNNEVEVNDGGTGETLTEPGGTFSVMRQGSTVARSTDTTTDGGAVFVKWQNGTAAEPLGSVSATSTADNRVVQGARWRGARTGAGLNRVTVNIPN